MAKNNCSDCFYRGSMGDGSIPYCRYIFMTNQRRPCPPGDGCTVKVKRKVPRKRRKSDDGK